MAKLYLGTVTAFDAERGIGSVTKPGSGTWPFHCTAISDGSRTIAVGAPVVFLIGAGHLGKEEARVVTRLGTGPSRN